jgi:hypothetical protein
MQQNLARRSMTGYDKSSGERRGAYRHNCSPKMLHNCSSNLASPLAPGLTTNEPRTEIRQVRREKQCRLQNRPGGLHRINRTTATIDTDKSKTMEESKIPRRLKNPVPKIVLRTDTSRACYASSSVSLRYALRVFRSTVTLSRRSEICGKSRARS